ncbi:MAG: LPS biosynthesis protein [Sandaracinus sp.]|nr:LPS biosynthesis protein [Sandaracinus sp.]|tara:strand:+ start:660 stop:1943 length:1284 start_codon:yes stop_codon:yes gene_type:complete
MEQVRRLVVGAGVSGLAFTDWLQDDDVLVVEAEHEIGGYCRTVEQDGFVWDYSGHFFHFRHPEIETYLVDRMADQEVRVIEKDSRIWYRGAFVDFPFQRNIHQLPKDELLECLYDLHFRAESHPPDQVRSFQDMLYAKFGRAIADKFLVPYNEKLYATDLSRLDVDAMGRFFPYADVDDVIRNFRRPENGSYNATFTYPERGAIQYVHALARDIDPARIALEERVVSIDLQARVARTTHREIRYQSLVSSMPLPTLLRLCGVPFDESIYSWNVVQVFNLGFDRKGPEGCHWVYFPQRELSFYRVGFYDNIFGTDRMSMYVELGRSAGFEASADEIEATRAQVIEDLRSVGFVDDHRLVSSHHVLLDPAYVHITRESVADVTAKKAALAGQGVHSIGRYGSWTYCSIEDNIVEARALADAFNLADAAG